MSSTVRATSRAGWSSASCCARMKGASLRFAHALVRDAVYEFVAAVATARTAPAGRRLVRGARPRSAAEHLDRAEAPEAARPTSRGAGAARRLPVRARPGAAGARPGGGARNRRICSRCPACRARRCYDLGAIADALQSFTRGAGTGAGRCGALPSWLGLAACKRMTEDLAGAQADLDLAEAPRARLGSTGRAGASPISSPAISASRAATSRAASAPRPEP